MTLRIALLAGLDEPVSTHARGEPAAFAFELASGLDCRARATQEVAADLFARRGSRTPLPLVGLDPGELMARENRAGSHERAAATEVLFCQAALAGLLEGYQVVHCLTPAIAALQIAAAAGAAVVQTIPGGRGLPAGRLLAHVVATWRLAQVAATPFVRGLAAGTRRCVPAGVDLTRFRPVVQPRRRHLLWLGSGGTAGWRLALGAAAALDLPLRTFGDDEVEPLLQHAVALLHLDPRPAPWGAVWPLRALACGTPVAGWAGCGLEGLAAGPVLGVLAPPGDMGALIAALRTLCPRPIAAAAGGRQRRQVRQSQRRQVCLGRHGLRAMVARYCEIYRELTEAA